MPVLVGAFFKKENNPRNPSAIFIYRTIAMPSAVTNHPKELIKNLVLHHNK